MNTPDGGSKYRQTMIHIHGSEDNWKKWLAENGRIGGKVRNPDKGFGSNRQLASEAGRLGGYKSRRGK